MINILLKNELKSLNNDLILRARQGKCGEINIHEMLKAVSVLDNSSAGQAYLLNHHSDEKFDDLIKMLNEITSDMRDGKMNITDLTTKYIDLIPPVEDEPQIEEEISQIE
jgi:hypothetical protein